MTTPQAAQRGAATAVLALAVAVLLALPLTDGGPARATAVAVFLLVAPGWCVVRLVRPVHDPLGFSLVVAISVAIVSLLALALLYTETWQPTIVTAVLAASAVVSAAHELWRAQDVAGETAEELR
jgi:uncharacterized membrane protein